VLLTVVVVAWGLTWPVNKVILESLPPLWMAALRSVIATVALFAIAVTFIPVLVAQLLTRDPTEPGGRGGGGMVAGTAAPPATGAG